jgi:DnaK suppressor protein
VAKQRSVSKAAKKSAGKASSAKPAAARTGAKTRTKAVARRPARPASRNGVAAAHSKSGKSELVESTQSFAAGRNGTARFSETGERLRKTHLSTADLEEFRELLTAKRHELIGDMNHLRSEALGHGSSGEGGGSSTMPIHMADIGSDTWEQELTLGLIEKERGMLREIEEALDRIEDRTYGICLATNKPISKARLRAKPWAKYCIEYARKRELGRY